MKDLSGLIMHVHASPNVPVWKTTLYFLYAGAVNGIMIGGTAGLAYRIFEVVK